MIPNRPAEPDSFLTKIKDVMTRRMKPMACVLAIDPFGSQGEAVTQHAGIFIGLDIDIDDPIRLMPSYDMVADSLYGDTLSFPRSIVYYAYELVRDE